MANEMRDRLVELFYENNVRCDQTIEHLADDVMSIFENDWIKPPCKVGDTVYIIGLDKKIEKYFVEGICLYQNGLFIEILYNGQGFSLPFNKVFLTKSEAEQKLKEMRGGE